MHTPESVGMTLKSLTDALQDIFSVSKSFDLCGSGSPQLIQTLASGGIKQPATPDAMRRLDHVSCSIESLFDFGRPKHIEPNYWLSKDSFFRITAGYVVTYNSFVHEHAVVYKDGRRTEAYERPCEQSIRVQVISRGFGLSQWPGNKEKIKALFSEAPDAIREKIDARIVEADSEIAKWKDAIEKQNAFSQSVVST